MMEPYDFYLITFHTLFKHLNTRYIHLWDTFFHLLDICQCLSIPFDIDMKILSVINSNYMTLYMYM